MSERTYNVLFLCTGNSARSILAETILNHVGKSRFKAHSAGSHPSGTVNPLVLEFLSARNMPAVGARSKSWDEFAQAGAPALDYVITVCDDAAGEVCPIWPGQPVTAHWGVEDPARYMDDPQKARQVIHEVFHILLRRIQLFVSLPAETLDRISLQARMREIGSLK
jgi:arsenate reductase